MAPATPHDAKGLLKSAIRDQEPGHFHRSPITVRTKGEVSGGEYTIPIGRAEVKREGRHVTIVAYSKMLLLALEAAEELAGQGIDVEVIDPRTLKPLDVGNLDPRSKKRVESSCCRRRVEICRDGRPNRRECLRAAFDYLDAPIVRVTGEDVPIPYRRPLEDLAIPDRRRIVDAVKKLLSDT